MINLRALFPHHRGDWDIDIPAAPPVNRDIALGPSANVWSSSSSSSRLFQLPLELLEPIASLISQGSDQSNFALANSDCQCRLLVRPYQFRALKLRVQESEHNTELYRIHQARLWRLIQESLHGVLGPLELPLGSFIRSLNVVECTKLRPAEKRQLPDAIFTLLSGLVNLDSFSHVHDISGDNNEMRRILSAKYITALRSTNIRHPQLEGFVGEARELRTMLTLDSTPWKLHTLVLDQRFNDQWPLTVLVIRPTFSAATLVTTLCSKTLRQLSLEYVGSLDFMFDGSLEFPQWEKLRLANAHERDPVPLKSYSVKAARLRELCITGFPLSGTTFHVSPSLRSFQIDLSPAPYNFDLYAFCQAHQELHTLSLRISNMQVHAADFDDPSSLSTMLAASLRLLSQLRSLKIHSSIVHSFTTAQALEKDVVQAIASIDTLEDLELYPAGNYIWAEDNLLELLTDDLPRLQNLRRVALYPYTYRDTRDALGLKIASVAGEVVDSIMGSWAFDAVIERIRVFSVLHHVESYAARLPLLRWMCLADCPVYIGAYRRAHVLMPQFDALKAPASPLRFF